MHMQLRVSRSRWITLGMVLREEDLLQKGWHLGGPKEGDPTTQECIYIHIVLRAALKHRAEPHWWLFWVSRR